MTIIATGNLAYVVINGSGASTYTFAFKAFPTDSDPAIYSVNVWLQDTDGTFTPQVQGAAADYTVTTTSSSAEAGTITFKVAVPTTKKVIIASATPYTQSTDLSSSNAALTGPVLEKALDKLVMQIRQLNRDISMSLHLELPPEIWPVTLLVDPVITSGATVFWERDAVQPSTYHLKSSDFTIDELRALVDEIQQAISHIDTAVATAQQAANNAANSAQQAANALTQLTSQIVGIIGDLNAIKVQVEGIKDAIQLIEDDVENMRDVVVQARDEAVDALHQIETLVAMFPSPAGEPINRTYVTDGDGHVVWQPYYPIIGMDTATDGQIIAVQSLLPSGKGLVVSTPVTTSEKVGTYGPVAEGGTTVSSALTAHEARLNALDNRASIYPFGKEHVVLDAIVNVDGNLRNTVDTTVIPKEGAPDLKYEFFENNVAYWTTGNNFTIPATIGGKAIMAPGYAMLFGLYIDSTTPDTVIFANTQFSIKKTGNNVQFIVGATTINIPITLNVWTFYCINFGGTGGTNLLIYHGAFDSGTVTVATVTGTITAIFNPETIAATLETNLRMVRLAFTDVIVSEDEFETWIYAIYGMKGSASYELPDPSTGTNGQAPVVEGGQYKLKTTFLVDPIATGWTVDNSVEIPSAITTGEYYTYFDVNATSKTAVLKQKTQTALPDPSTGANGQAILVNNGTYTLGYVPNFTNLPAGWTIVDTINAGTDLNTTGYFYWFFQVDAIAKTITLKVAKMIPSTKPNVILYNTLPTPGTAQLLVASNPAAKSRLIQNNSQYDIVVGEQAQLTANIDQGWLIPSGQDQNTDINGALYVVFPTGATAFPPNTYIRITEEVIV